MTEQGSRGCRGAVPPAAGSQGGGYQEGSSSRAPLEEIILQLLTLVQIIGSSSYPDPKNITALRTGVFLTPGAVQGFGAGAAGAEAAAEKCPGGASPLPTRSPAQREQPAASPTPSGPAHNVSSNPPFSLPTNLFQFIKLTNRG